MLHQKKLLMKKVDQEEIQKNIDQMRNKNKLINPDIAQGDPYVAKTQARRRGALKSQRREKDDSILKETSKDDPLMHLDDSMRALSGVMDRSLGKLPGLG